MAHRALVIGVDDYVQQSSLNLQGAVGDAVSMTKWLVDRAGGAVPPNNVTLLTSPALNPVPPELNGVVCIGSATAQSINEELIELPNKAAQPNDRLYLYFSGHGLTAPTDFAQEAILPADFATGNLGVAMGVRSILDWLKTSNYNQQFVFIDACRNAMVSQRFTIAGFALIPDPAKLRPYVEQFVYMSTSRGLTATEAVLVGNTREGVFTGALVDGLRGAGDAKTYNVPQKTYDVTSNSLVPYLADRVRKQIGSLTFANGADPATFLQTPTFSGERFSDPVICSFARDLVEPVTLTVNVDPNTAWAASTILVERDDVEVHKVSPPPIVPYKVRLAPKEYSVTATATAYTSNPLAWPLKLYDDASLEFTMIPAVAPAAAAATAATPASVPRPTSLATAVAAGTVPVAASEVTARVGGNVSSTTVTTSGASAHVEVRTGPALSSVAGVEIVNAKSAVSESEPQGPDLASLTVTTGDSSSPLEIERSGNEQLKQGRSIMASGTHSITAKLNPGIYLARLRAPNGRSVEKLVRLLGGTEETVTLEPPQLADTDPIADLASQVGFTAEKGTIDLSDSSGLTALAWVRLSTILSAAANAQVFSAMTLSASRLRSLGLNTLHNLLQGGARSAIQLVFGDELRILGGKAPVDGTSGDTPQRAEIDSISVACFGLDTFCIENEERPTVLLKFDFIAEHSIALSPGSYWLSVRDRGAAGTFIPVTILPDRVTNLIFTRNQRGRVSIFVYQPSPSGDPRETMQIERRIEMAQRYLLSGQIGDASLLSPSALEESPNANELLNANNCDPIAGLLGAYLALRSIEAAQQKVLIGNPALSRVKTLTSYLAEQFPSFPDAHVLEAEIAAKYRQKEAVIQSLHQALNAGIPVFDEGLLRLSKLINVFAVEHPRTALIGRVLQNRIPGMLWTVCAPQAGPQTTIPVPAPASWSAAPRG